jgi:hypothetical protein
MVESGLTVTSTPAVSQREDILHENLTPNERFLLALKAPETKRQYPKRLESFFDFLQLQSSFEEKTVSFCKIVKTQKESEWLTDQLLTFLRYKKERVTRTEIEEAIRHIFSRPFSSVNTSLTICL